MLLFPFWSWLIPRQCQIFFERSLGHFLHCAETLTSPQECQPHVAFNGWTLQSPSDLLFAEGAPRRKEKSHGLASAQDRSLTAVQQWKKLCMTACNSPFQIGKQSAHSGSARWLPHLQRTVLLFNGPGGKISEKEDALIWVPSETKGCKKEKLCELSGFAVRCQECCYSSFVK